MFPVLHPPKKGNLWVIHGSFMTPVVWSFFIGKLFSFPIVPSHGCASIRSASCRWFTTKWQPGDLQNLDFHTPKQIEVGSKIFKEIASFWNNLCKNMSLLKHPHSIAHLFGFYGGIFQFNDPTVSPPARLLPTRYLPPSPATGNPSHPATPGDLSYGLRLRCL